MLIQQRNESGISGNLSPEEHVLVLKKVDKKVSRALDRHLRPEKQKTGV
jgi:hypothetical protein